MQCRYCLSEEPANELIQPCNCQGSLKFVHEQCLLEWIHKSNKQMEYFPTDLCKNNTCNNLNSLLEFQLPLYTIDCEICKYRMKCYHVYQHTFSWSLFSTVKMTLTDIKNLPFLIFNVFVLYYMMSEVQFMIYYTIQMLLKPLKTRLLMRFANEIIFFTAFLWFTNDIFKVYKNLFWEQRGVLTKFLTKREVEKCFNINVNVKADKLENCIVHN